MPIRVLDPFAGGGAIPLEALRLGCETYAGEYNPVAVLILKCTLEYPQKYGKSGIRNQGSGISEELFPNSQSQMPNPLLNGQWMVTDSQTPMPDAQSLLANFDPAKGTVKGAVARCLVCGSTVDANTTRKLFQEGKASQRMIATVLHHPKKKGKTYRVATGKDLEVFREAEKYLEEKRTKLKEEWGIDPVPDEGLVRTGGNQIAVLHYGMYKFGACVFG